MKSKSILIKLFFIPVCLLLNFPAVGFAEGKLLMAITFWPPFLIASSDEKYGFAGIDIDILEGLEKYLNLPIEIQQAPFARTLEMIKTGDVDLISSVAYTDKRNEFILYVPTPYYAVGPAFYTQNGQGHLVQNYEDLYKYTVGYVRGSAYFEPFNSDAKLKKKSVNSEEQLIKMMALGRFDIIIGTNPNIAFDIKNYNIKHKVMQTQYIPEKKTSIYFGLSRKHNNTILQEKIDDYLKLIISNGELNQITEKYK